MPFSSVSSVSASGDRPTAIAPGSAGSALATRRMKTRKKLHEASPFKLVELNRLNHPIPPMSNLRKSGSKHLTVFVQGTSSASTSFLV